MNVCYYHVTYAFQSESTLYSCLNVKELLAWNWRDIWSLSDSSGNRTQNQLVSKRTVNHLAKLTKWLSCVLSTYSVRCIWLYVVIMPCTRFRVNLHSIVAWMSRNSLLLALIPLVSLKPCLRVNNILLRSKNLYLYFLVIIIDMTSITKQWYIPIVAS